MMKSVGKPDEPLVKIDLQDYFMKRLKWSRRTQVQHPLLTGISQHSLVFADCTQASCEFCRVSTHYMWSIVVGGFFDEEAGVFRRQ